MRYKFLLFLWLLNVVVPYIAECRPVKGIVKDASTDSNISFANVMAYALPDSTLLGFAVTDDEGLFSLTTSEEGRLLLKVSCLGYKTAEVELSSAHDSLCISMQPDAVLLKNVVVKGRMPGFKVRGDTIDYNYQKYTDGSEKVLKDILMKLPGMDVNDKGQVTANGEAVKKILINGQDFFGDHNEQVTNNLPSDYVDKIQLRKNYSEYSFVEGFKTRKTTALNVTIDSLHSGNVTGNAEVLGGYRDKYRGAMNLFSFGEKVMWGINTKLFNTGEEMMTLVDYVKLMGSIKDYAKAVGGSDKIIDNGHSPVSYIDNNINTYQRTNGMASANIAWNPSNRFKINAYYLFNHEQSKGQYDITRSYWTRNTIETMSQSTDAKRDFHHVGVSTKSVMASNAALDWKFTVTAMPQTSQNWLGAYSWDEKTDVWNFSHNLAFVKNWNNRNLLSVSSQLVYNNIHRTIDVESADSLLYVPELQIHSVSQRQRITLLDHHLAASWTHRLSKAWLFKMNTAWNTIHSTMLVTPSSIQPIAKKDKETTRLYSYGLSIQKNKGLLRFDAGFDLAYLNQGCTDDKVVVLPNASIELAFSSINSLMLSYTTGYKRDDSYFARGTVINDYRQLTVYDGKENLMHKHHNLTLSSHYFNVLSDFSWIMDAGCSFTENPYIFSNDGFGNTIYASLIQTNRDQVLQHIYINVKKGFRFPITLSLKSTMSNSLYQSAYFQKISNNRHSEVDSEVSITSKFKRALLNMEVGCRFSFQQSKIGLTSSVLNFRSYETYVRPFLVKKGKWDVSLPIIYIHDQSGAQHFSYFDCAILASYTKGRWTFFADGKNLLHTKCFERITVDAEHDYMETVVDKRLPGYIVVGLKKMF